MKVALDVDDTLFKNTVIHDALVEFDFHGTYSWDLHEIPPDILAIIKQRFAEPSYMCSLEPFDGTQQVITAMNNSGMELHAVTSRLPSVHDETKTMISKVFPEIQSVFFGSDSKRTILMDNKFDMLIDDSPKYLEEVVDLDIKKILISNKYTPYNFEFKNKFKDSIMAFSSIVKFWGFYNKS